MTTFRLLALPLALAALASPLNAAVNRPVAFDPDGILNADIRYTAFGVPHIKADNLQSLAFGVGYAFATDNACVLADMVLRVNSQRARYFGPDLVAGSGDGQHLVSDYGYLALGVREQAEQGLAAMSANSRAMLSGYAQGYNRYLQDTGVANIDQACAGQEWVRPITDVDMLAALLSIALLPGSGQFLPAMFVAAPPGSSYLPVPVVTLPAQGGNAGPAGRTAAVPTLTLDVKASLPEKNPLELGSNGWALGSRKTDNGQGMLLANPHFPHTGSLRFWQFHTTIPGTLDVMGASLSGAPGMVNIGFNQHLAWTHTFSTAEHVIAYQLGLDPADATGLTYMVDGTPRQIQAKDFVIDVLVAPGMTMPFRKTMYFSDFGPVFSVPDQLPWGTQATGQFAAYAVKDANAANFDLIDHWLAMDMATDMKSFRNAFRRYDGVIFNNTIAVDAQGNAFYIDDSTVPYLSSTAEYLLTTDPVLTAMRSQTGISFLPGTSAIFDFNASVPFDKAPKLTRRDFVQNSNDSFWLTQPQQPITGVSTLYGKTGNEQSLRSRLGQKMLQDSAGKDGRFSLDELEAALFSQRVLLAEEVLADLIAQCEAQGSQPVLVDAMPVDLAPACAALRGWDGRGNSDSKGAHLFREFAQRFATNPQWAVPFDPAQPLTTPNTLKAGVTTLEHLARAVLTVQAAGIALDAPLGDVQFVERTQVDGRPTGERIAWPGTAHVEGGFNVFRPVFSNDGSLLPRHVYPALPGSSLSAEGQGYHIAYGSSWMMVVGFDQQGPKARGLLTMSQSSRIDSEHNADQTRHYSQGPQLVDIPFHEADVAAQTVRIVQVTSTQGALAKEVSGAAGTR